MAALPQIVAYLDRYLQVAGFEDWPNALNGLQIASPGKVRRLGAAVDACEFSLRAAAEQGVDLLLVHHGMFWSGLQPVTGPQYRKLRLALEAGLALYSAHLPLDVHPAVGNNVLLCAALGLGRTIPFFMEKGRLIGRKATASITRDELVSRLETVTGGRVHLCPGGPVTARKIGVVTGGAGAEIARAASEGVDTFVTGEAPHWAFTAAEELGVNLILGGHYATETFGVKALAAHLARRFKLPWVFIDHPTGL